jgi:hypothetical protein
VKLQVGYSLDGVSLSLSVELAPEGEALASVSCLTPEARESVFCEAWGHLHPQVAAQLNESLQRLTGEILQKFSLACSELSLAAQRESLGSHQ